MSIDAAFSSDLLLRRETQFTLWRPSISVTPPVLVIGTFAFGNPNTLANRKDIPLSEPEPETPGLWAIAVGKSGLPDGIYHYWFQVENTNPAESAAAPILCTDPFATTVDWRLLSPSLPAGFNNDTDRQPASVIRLRNGRLSAIDPGGETASFPDDPKPDTLPANNHLVIYELPTAWTRVHDTGTHERGVGTFKDVLALVDEAASGANFEGLDVLNPGGSYLTELGVNALELLPPADSFFKRAWGYDTSHFLAPDWELGFPDGQAASTSNADLAALVQSCHHHGIRFFIDVVMAFGRNEAYQWIDFDDFYIADPCCHPTDPDALTSRRGDGSQSFRDGFGSTVFRYTRPTPKLSWPMNSVGTAGARYVRFPPAHQDRSWPCNSIRPPSRSLQARLRSWGASRLFRDTGAPLRPIAHAQTPSEPDRVRAVPGNLPPADNLRSGSALCPRDRARSKLASTALRSA